MSPGGRVEAERRAHAHLELAREVARHEDAGAGAHGGERRPPIARREAEVRRALGREGARVERVDADARAPVGVLGEAHALDAGHARHGAQAVADGLVERRLDPARGGGRGDHQVGAHLAADEVEHGLLEAARHRRRRDHEAEAQGEDRGRERELIGDADEAVDGEAAGEAERLARGAEEEGRGPAGEAHEDEHQGEVGGERRHVPAPG